MSGSKNRRLKKIAQQQAEMKAKANNEPCTFEFEATVGDQNLATKEVSLSYGQGLWREGGIFALG